MIPKKEQSPTTSAGEWGLIWLALSPMIFALYGAWMFVQEFLVWIHSGAWPKVSLLKLFLLKPNEFPPTELPLTIMQLLPASVPPTSEFGRWLEAPNDWLGIHAITMWILDAVPLTMFCIVVPFCIWFGACIIADSAWAKQKRANSSKKA